VDYICKSGGQEVATDFRRTMRQEMMSAMFRAGITLAQRYDHLLLPEMRDTIAHAQAMSA
jgi:hypothetical protein